MQLTSAYLLRLACRFQVLPIQFLNAAEQHVAHLETKGDWTVMVKAL